MNTFSATPASRESATAGAVTCSASGDLLVAGAQHLYTVALDGTVAEGIDTIPGAVWSRTYDPGTGAAGQRTEFLHLPDGSPDGMCVDAGGNLWIAIWLCAGQLAEFPGSGRLFTCRVGVRGLPVTPWAGR